MSSLHIDLTFVSTAFQSFNVDIKSSFDFHQINAFLCDVWHCVTFDFTVEGSVSLYIYIRGSHTCGVRLAVVLSAVLHLDRWQTERLHHLVGSLTPIGGAESRDGQGEGQWGEGKGQWGTVTSGHFLQHGGSSGGRKPGRKENDGWWLKGWSWSWSWGVTSCSRPKCHTLTEKQKPKSTNTVTGLSESQKFKKFL